MAGMSDWDATGGISSSEVCEESASPVIPWGQESADIAQQDSVPDSVTV